ncbi:uncharacterized protein LOC110621053 isoform X6 [Manihot esculenta]|uniref:uncharacterized protein LOC110621053 isoform X6 n=1 Tax=Manihot esculenta TaxID=3983 RepID=UPI000B5D4D37|nr:uncharacterized protein LOC110621053 isoform X6 [Manihot esculenta]
MIDQFINFVIRPPRADYNPDQYLWEKDFTLAGRAYKRQDLELTNARGHTLQCSHYVPSPFPEDTPLPCVIYCHGNSGCRADANEAAVILLPSNITVFALDFSGSGLSDGEYVSLGWHERHDLKVVVSYLRSNQQISRIGLWGRSMGAVTCLLYGAEDPSIAGMVLDSAFSNLFDLMMELVDVYKIRLPKFTVKMAVQYMRRIIQKKAKFDIMDLNCLKSLLCEIITGLRSAFTDAASSSSAPPSFPTTKPVSELLYETMPVTSILVDSPVNESDRLSSDEPSKLQDKPNGQSEECCSYTSSNRESWGRCSSLGGSDEESSAECRTTDKSQETTLKAFATPLRSIQQNPNLAKEEKKKKKTTVAKKLKGEKFDRLEAFSKRLRHCILKRVNHQRHCSS